jgi:carboxylate-amine ligase
MADFADLTEELIDFLGPDAEALGCRAELLHARRIAREGTSSDRQRAVYAKAVEAGAEPQEALCAVVDALIDEFLDH